ncbi:MAG: DUF4089 domain-containing protein [Minwuia sp.]|nr:DUF4089 domain-containing protein [Minwuia sp.]
MSDDTTFDAEGHMDAMAATLGLSITDAQRPGVIGFLQLAARMNGILEDVPVPVDTLELATVYNVPERAPAGDDA